MITLVAMVCHALSGISSPVCHEEIVVRAQGTMMACMMSSQPMLAQWKENSRFSDAKWEISGFSCQPGDYQPRDAI